MVNDLSDVMPFSRHLGIAITTATPQRVVAQMVVRPEMCTIYNVVHGGAIMAFADSLGAVAAFLNLPEGASGTTTIESKTNFLGAGPEGATLLGGDHAGANRAAPVCLANADHAGRRQGGRDRHPDPIGAVTQGRFAAPVRAAPAPLTRGAASFMRAGRQRPPRQRHQDHRPQG